MTDIFRHYRPTKKGRPAEKGGLSFLLRPTDYRVYNYWVYMCPLDTEFSAKQAVKTLRDRADSNVKPWGRVDIQNETPLIDLILEDLNNLTHELPSDAPKLAELIRQNRIF